MARAPRVTEGELVEEDDSAPGTREGARGGRPGDAPSYDDDVGVAPAVSAQARAFSSERAAFDAERASAW